MSVGKANLALFATKVVHIPFDIMPPYLFLFSRSSILYLKNSKMFWTSFSSLKSCGSIGFGVSTKNTQEEIIYLGIISKNLYSTFGEKMP